MDDRDSDGGEGGRGNPIHDWHYVRKGESKHIG